MSTKQNRTTPDFMTDEKAKYSEFKISAVLGLKYNETDNQSHTFIVQIQNVKTNFTQKVELAPELLRHRFKIGKIYKNGDFIRTDTSQKIDYFVIDTSLPTSKQEYLSVILSEQEKVHLVGDFGPNIKMFCDNSCYVFEDENEVIIIPSYVVALYYFFRSTSMKEALFNGNPNILFDKNNSNLKDKSNAHIVLSSKAALFDGPFIFRFAEEKSTANFAFIDFFNFITIAKGKNDIKPKPSIALPIKALFPTREAFRIKLRYSELPQTNPNAKKRLFVTEIINDGSTLDFEKLTVIKSTKKNPYEASSDKKIVIKGRRAKKTLPKTGNQRPSSLYRTNTLRDMEEEKNMELDNKDVIYAGYEDRDNTKNKIGDKTQDPATQSFARGSLSGDGGVRPSSLESKSDDKKEPIVKPPNFDVFRTCVEFLESGGIVGDIELDESHRSIPEGFNKNGSLKDMCSIDGRTKQYLTCSFIFNDMNVVLVEVESEKADFATWVLSSVGEIAQSQVDELLITRYSNGAKIDDLYENYSDVNSLKFVTKKHPIGDEKGNIDEEDIERWAMRLLRRIN